MKKSIWSFVCDTHGSFYHFSYIIRTRRSSPFVIVGVISIMSVIALVIHSEQMNGFRVSFDNKGVGNTATVTISLPFSNAPNQKCKVHNKFLCSNHT
jgi:ABC-type lipoprotein release transport system permease subunit